MGDSRLVNKYGTVPPEQQPPERQSPEQQQVEASEPYAVEGEPKVTTCYELASPGLFGVNFRLKTGDCFAPSYWSLATRKYDKSTGITLIFSDCKVVIAGRSLDELFQGFIQNRVAWVLEVGERYDTANEGEPVITSITIEEL